MVALDSTANSIFVVILVELTNTVFVNSTSISTDNETTVLSRFHANVELLCIMFKSLNNQLLIQIYTF